MSTTYYDPINNRQKDASLFTGGLTGGRLSFERGFSHFYKVTNVLSGPRAGLEGVALPLRSDTHRSYDGTKEGIASSPDVLRARRNSGRQVLATPHRAKLKSPFQEILTFLRWCDKVRTCLEHC